MPDKKPSYLALWEKGELDTRVQQAREHLHECYLCPHRCGIDREIEKGFCRAPHQAVVSSYGPHMGEEPQLVGSHGSGTIFFSFCQLRCVYCQNWAISQAGQGKKTTTEELARMMLRLQQYHLCHNINLVTPTHFVPRIVEALLQAVAGGLTIPIVYNCSGYENIETLQMLDGIIDIYMPDFKYSSEERARKYSGIKGYPRAAREALKEMNRQVGGLKTDERGIAYRGLLIRHLMLPGGLEDTTGVLQFIKAAMDPGCMLNLMMQYYPAYQAHEYPELARRLYYQEYQEAVRVAEELGLQLI